MNLIQHFVGGKIFKGTSKRTGKVFNPATGEQSSEAVSYTHLRAHETPEHLV